ncbi:MAG: hypothetical protein WB506_03685, partial [Candidatus Sulfotelmatobacter sp.]
MSRKKLRLDRRIEVLSRDPAHSVSLPLKMFGLLLLSILVSFLGCWWQRSSVQDAASRTNVNHGS